MSRQFGFQAVKSYDKQFRKVRKLMNLDWGLINDEMWRMAAFGTRNSGIQSSMSTSQFKGLKNGPTPFQRRAEHSQLPTRYCWAYGRTGCAQIHNASINTSVQTVTKNMQHYHVQNH